jgi:hypothetical protein
VRVFHATDPDGVLRTYTGFTPDEIGAPPAAPTRHPQGALLERLIRLFGSWNASGPLMDACARSAENEARGGHSPETRRRAQRELHLPSSTSLS